MFCFMHVTPSHYHHLANLLTCNEQIHGRIMIRWQSVVQKWWKMKLTIENWKWIPPNNQLLGHNSPKYLLSSFYGCEVMHDCIKALFPQKKMVFYNTSPPRMFLSLDLLWEYRIQHGANGPLYVTSSYSTWIFCRGVSCFATDCPCGVWCRGLTTCLLHVGPPFGNRMLNNSWAVGLT